jgi:uncharacterized protein
MLALITTLGMALVSAIAVPPKPAAYVTDKAAVLDPARVKVVSGKLAQFERDTSDQILVYVDQHLPPDTTIEQFANEAVHQWGVGQKGKDNGAALFLFTGDHKMRIEVGYGLEAVLTDAKARQITSTIIKPRLQAADYNGAVEQGVDAILAAARGQEYKGTGRTVHQTTSAPSATTAIPCVGIALVMAFFILGIIVLIAKRGGRGVGGGTYVNTAGSTPDSSSSFTDTSSSSSSDSSSSSSSDSGFDGGGGDSGGGGASDSW